MRIPGLGKRGAEQQDAPREERLDINALATELKQRLLREAPAETFYNLGTRLVIGAKGGEAYCVEFSGHNPTWLLPISRSQARFEYIPETYRLTYLDAKGNVTVFRDGHVEPKDVTGDTFVPGDKTSRVASEAELARAAEVLSEIAGDLWEKNRNAERNEEAYKEKFERDDRDRQIRKFHDLSGEFRVKYGVYPSVVVEHTKERGKETEADRLQQILLLERVTSELELLEKDRADVFDALLKNPPKSWNHDLKLSATPDDLRAELKLGRPGGRSYQIRASLLDEGTFKDALVKFHESRLSTRIGNVFGRKGQRPGESEQSEE